MRNTRVFKLISSLSDEDLKKCRKYLKEERLILLYDLIKSTFLDKSGNELSSLGIAKTLKISENRVNYWVNRLTVKLRSFIAERELEDDWFLKGMMELRYLNREETYELFDTFYLQLQKKVEASESKDQLYFERCLELERIRNLRFAKDPSQRGKRYLEHVVKCLDKEYILNKLVFECALLNQNKVLNKEWEGTLMEQIIEYVNNKPDLPPLIQIYACIYQLLKDSSSSHSYNDLVLLIQEHQSNFRKDKVQAWYMYAINYCTRKITQGYQVYLSKAMQMYDVALQGQFLQDDQGNLSYWLFKNVIETGLRAKEVDWASEKFNTYKSLLPLSHKEIVLSYSKGIIAFHRHKYKEALDHLKEILPHEEAHDDKINQNEPGETDEDPQNPRYAQYKWDPFFKIDTRIYEIKIYYEWNVDEFVDQIDRSITSARRFINRNTYISEKSKQRYRNFLNIFQKLWTTLPAEKEELLALKQKLENKEEEVFKRDWLLEMLNEKLS